MPLPGRHIVNKETPLAAASPRSGRLVRNASFSSALAAVAIVAVLVVVASFRPPPPVPAPIGAAGVTPGSEASEPVGSWIAILPIPTEDEGPGLSPEGTAVVAQTPEPTRWTTSPPSACHPYVTPCDPTIPPVYDYVSVIITTDGSTDADIGIGKVKVTAAGATYSCSTYSHLPDCYWDIPPGVSVVATVFAHAGSFCTYFELMWADHTGFTHDDCSPITFTTRKQKAQLTANFDRLPSLPPATPTEPPVTAPPTPAITPADTPAPS